MDIITRSIICGTAVLGLLSASGIGAGASSAVEPGRRCFGSESAINDNLPLGKTSDETDIHRIEAVFVPASHRIVGWLYMTRNGSAFIQVGSENDLADVFRNAGDDDLAAVVAKSRPFAYYRLSAAQAKAIRHKPSIVLASCYGTGK
ncbi:MAG: hypothetical protein M3N13_09675 [Candidatus Eremiobacteraeota bacterium]|nr:hypothetical protein [Candidatus Eremiobacteraeota bacterium]